jgi:hypothetical protein
MSEMLYGQLQSEKLAKDNQIAREIVREIGNFGINDRQRWLVMYHLAMELENVDEMKEVTSFIKDVKGTDIFVSKLYSGEEDSNG